MPSSTIACCNAARRITSLSTQSSALWITDDHLNHAFNRWAQATQHSSKRRGSSVPGPLEARKRASGRRHSASAYIERSPVESAFGWPFWGSSAVPPNVGWKYEPPWPTSNVLESIEKAFFPPAEPAANAGDGANAEFDEAIAEEPSAIELRLQQLYGSTTVSYSKKLTVDAAQKNVDPTLFVQTVFKTLLTQREPISQLEPFFNDPLFRAARLSNFRFLLEFLKDNSITHHDGLSVLSTLRTVLSSEPMESSDVGSVLDLPFKLARKASPERATKLFLRLSRNIWDCLRSTVDDTMRDDVDRISVLHMLRGFVQLGNLGDSLSDALAKELSQGILKKDVTFFYQMAKLVRIFSEKQTLKPCARKPLLSFLVEILQSLERQPNRKWARKVTRVLAANCKDMNGKPLPPHRVEELATWHKIISIWLESLPESVEQSFRMESLSKSCLLPEVYSSLDEAQACSLLLRHILHNFFNLNKDLQGAAPLKYRLAAAQEAFGKYLSHSSRRANHSNFVSHFGKAVALLEEQSCLLEKDGIAHLSLFIYQAFGSKSLLLFLRSLAQEGRDLGTPLPASTIKKLSSSQPQTIVHILRYAPKLSQFLPPSILPELAKVGAIAPQDVYHLLKLFTSSHTRAPTGTTTTLTLASLDLVHSLAHALAHSPHRTTSTTRRHRARPLPHSAFKSVLRCHAFIHRHVSRAPTAPLLRALVHAGLTRPLLELRWPSPHQVSLVLSLARAAEGDAAARRLAALVDSWQRRLLARAVGRWRALGLPGRARVGALTRLGLWGDGRVRRRERAARVVARAQGRG